MPQTLFFNSKNWNVPQDYTVTSIDNEHFNNDIDAKISFVVVNYAIKAGQLFTVKVLEYLDPPYGQTVVKGETSPTNKTSLYWTWNSFKGEQFRYKRNNEDWNYTTYDSYQSPILPEGKHIFCVQERLNVENPEIWSTEDCHETIIDSGVPCTKKVNVTLDNNVFSISYTIEDRYECQLCDSPYSSCPETITDRGTGIKEIELWVQKPGEAFQRTDIDAINETFTYTATINGTYRFYVKAIDKANNSKPDPQSTDGIEKMFADDNFAGYAILVVGGVPNDNSGKDSHTLTANNIYKNLVNRGFSMNGELSDDQEDHIKYFNQYSDISYIDENLKNAYKDTLAEAIKVWAKDEMNNYPGPLYIILVDHGAKEKFYMESLDKNGLVTPTDLNDWISDLERNLKIPQDIIIIIGACYSGSFIHELSGQGRIIITSAAEDEVSFRGAKNSEKPRDGSFFLTSLFNELGKGTSLYDSFVIADKRTEQLTFSKDLIMKGVDPFYDTAKQHPLLDDNGDQKGHNTLPSEGDGHRTKNIYLGYNYADKTVVKIERADILPKIIIPDTEYINFTMEVSDTTQINKAWVEIRTPEMLTPSSSENNYQLAFDLVQLNLDNQLNSNLYELRCCPDCIECKIYEIFKTPGKYTIFFNIETIDETMSGFNETYVYKTKVDNHAPDAFEQISPVNIDASNSEHTESTQLMLVWEKSNDRDEDFITYTAIVLNDTTKKEITKEGINETFCFIDLPSDSDDDWDNKDIKWKIIATDEFGASNETGWWKFHTDNTNDIPATIFGQVYDPIKKKPLAADIQYQINNEDFTKSCDGTYKLQLNKSGLLVLNVISDGYEPETRSISINEGERFPIYFELKSKPQGDFDQNRTLDLNDAFLCLRLLSGFSVQNQSFQQNTFVNENSVTLNDAIYIMKLISRQ